MSLLLGLSVYAATANSCIVVNENMLLGFFVLGGGYSNQKVVLRVIAEKIKKCTYVYIRNNPYTQYVS